MKRLAVILVACGCCAAQAGFAADTAEPKTAPPGTSPATAPSSASEADTTHGRIERSPLRAARAANPNLPPLATRLPPGRRSSSEASEPASANTRAPSEPQKVYSNRVTDGYAH